MNYIGGKAGIVGCLSPRGDYWLRKKRRPMMYPEKFAIQGIMEGTYDPTGLSMNELSVLAGGSFNMPCVLPLILAWLTVFNWDWS